VTLTGAIVAGIVAPALSHSVLALALGQAAFAVGALVLWLSSRHYRRTLVRNTARDMLKN
jgi:DHA1 family bicyclomycin/chloramphenicol resistance-like MFS transporter